MKMRFSSVREWLRWQETLNPRGIDLGLDRCRPVSRALDLDPAPYPVVIVAGTNGKGSCVAMLESILDRAGYVVGSYTSPHLCRFNETARIACQAISDAELMQAFARVDDARAGIALTWFEYRTLAAANWFATRNIDIAVMEVGLGGRLDAVNLFDAEVAVITSIGVDHRDWLGDSRDEIAREKAGICRAGRPAVCGDPDPPPALIETAAAVGARLYVAGRDFCHSTSARGWRWKGPGGESALLPLPGIPGRHQLGNASAALMALDLVRARFPLGPESVANGMAACRLPGRLELIPGEPEIMLDVAHNPDAANALAEALETEPARGRIVAVFAMYSDKDVEGVARALGRCVDAWHVAPLPPPRGASREAIRSALAGAGIASPVHLHEAVPSAFTAARADAGSAGRVVVFGSFETVRQVLGA